MTSHPPHGSLPPNIGLPPVEWYIGRDGKQYGPVTDLEFRKLIELGHLKPTDLVWREGFAEWRPARFLTEAPAAPRLASTPPPSSLPGSHAAPMPRDARQPVSHGAAHGGSGAPIARAQPRAPEPQHEDDDFESEDDAVAEGRVGRRLKIAAAIIFFVFTLAAAGWLLLPYKDSIVRSVAVAIPNGIGKSTTSSETGEFKVLAGFAADRARNDAMLQESALFQLLKRSHAQWYEQRLDEITKAVEGGAQDAKVVEGLVQGLAQLRRQHAGDVLSAPAERLTSIAASFVTNLGLLRGVGVDACYKFISNGETAPGIVPLFQSKELSGPLQRQLLAVFTAADQGRSTPRVYPMPRQADYTALLGELEARGWTQADMQLFSDSRALAKAAPQDVCRLVTEWFESQLALKDSDVQLRLIADSLKPLIAG